MIKLYPLNSGINVQIHLNNHKENKYVKKDTKELEKKKISFEEILNKEIKKIR